MGNPLLLVVECVELLTAVKFHNTLSLNFTLKLSSQTFFWLNFALDKIMSTSKLSRLSGGCRPASFCFLTRKTFLTSRLSRVICRFDYLVQPHKKLMWQRRRLEKREKVIFQEGKFLNSTRVRLTSHRRRRNAATKRLKLFSPNYTSNGAAFFVYTLIICQPR